VDLTGGVAVRVSALCLDSRGRLADRLLCGTAVRAGLLLDLALAGRLESEDDSIVVDGTPTGFWSAVPSGSAGGTSTSPRSRPPATSATPPPPRTRTGRPRTPA
jgi:hypothetical protein